ncbi:MAG: efflux RND transporter periplasmic adaptor subunit [Desulfovibrio sp.]|uniref:efflux RND transporter periplasmic adaptor subunit n=1 Tax=Desulfovibrio sp. 7SRBS1 TaxID=3378064 RepID=UPI003B3DAC70
MRHIRPTGVLLASMVFGLLLCLPGFGFAAMAENCPGDSMGNATLNADGTARAVRQEVCEVYEAVGTVRPRTEIRIESQVTAKILKVEVRPGVKVNQGDTLIRLDARELQARLERAQQGLNSARSARKQAVEAIAAAKAADDKARTTFGRMEKLHKQGVIASEDLDLARRNAVQAVSALRQAEDGRTGATAQVSQAEKVLEEARINLGYATISAPDSGEIIRRMADPGDLAVPGRSLLLLQTGKGMWVEAMVREGLIAKAPLGSRMEVKISAIGAVMEGQVEEVVPLADARTRTFLVRVGLPSVQGLYQGMFARLRIPVRTYEAVLVPKSAVRRVGQLESVRLKTPEGWRTVYVRTGGVHGKNGELVEILSGLEGGETLQLQGVAPQTDVSQAAQASGTPGESKKSEQVQ